MMLDHPGETEAARAIVGVITRVLSERALRTRDLGKAGTLACGRPTADTLADALAQALG